MMMTVVLAAMGSATLMPAVAEAQTGATLSLWPSKRSVVAVTGTNRYFAVYDPDGPGPELPQWLDPGAVTWSSNKPLIMSVTSPGVVYGRLRGNAGLIAQYKGLTAQVKVTVTGVQRSFSFQTPDGRTRSYLVYVPDTYQGSPTPLVLAFHGGQGSGQVMMYQTQLNTVAAVSNFIVAYPSGVEGHWNAGGCCGPVPALGVDDVGFVRLLLGHIRARANIDPARIFATGFSNGAMLSHRLAFEMSDEIAAIAPVGAGMYPGGSFEPRSAPRPVSVLQFMGTTDPDFAYEAVENSIDYWRYVNDMGLLPSAITYASGIVSCETWVKSSTEVSFCTADPPEEIVVGDVTYDGGGHAWPGGVKVYVSWADIPTFDIDASWVIWQFFARHPKL